MDCNKILTKYIHNHHKILTFIGKPWTKYNFKRITLDILSDITFKEKLALSLIQGNLKRFIETQNPKLNVNSDTLLPYLRWNRLISYFYYTIKNEKTESCFDQEFIQKLSAEFTSETLKSLKREAVFKKVLALFSENNIQTIVFKGGLFAYTYYQLPALRPSYDIDLLIRQKDIAKAEKILINAGFNQWYELESTNTMGQLPHLPGLKYLDIPIELHHHLFSGFDKQPVTNEEIFASAKKSSLLGYNVQILSPEINLYYLLNHIQKHINEGYTRLIWFLDIKLLLNKERIDIESLNRWLSQYDKKKEIEKLIHFTEVVTNFKFYNSNGNDEIISFYLSKCQNNREKEYIKTIKAIRNLPDINTKLKYILGRIFPSIKYVTYKYGIKRKILVPFYYFRIYWEYLIKLYRVLMND